MLRIRLSRTGKKRQPSYRVVVAEKDAKRDGRVVERIGFYNPRTEPLEFRIDEDRALYWLSVGAQPSDAVQILLNKQGTMDRLARLHAGESRESLVAEYQGTAAPTAAAPVAKAVAAVVEAVETPTVVAEPEEAAVAGLEEAIDAVVSAEEEE